MDVAATASRPWATDTTTADDILALLEPPAWHADAACKEAPATVSWFPEAYEDGRAAVAVCQLCLVADKCRAWALAQGRGCRGSGRGRRTGSGSGYG